MKHFPLALLCATSVSGLQNETKILLPNPLGKYNGTDSKHTCVANTNIDDKQLLKPNA